MVRLSSASDRLARRAGHCRWRLTSILVSVFPSWWPVSTARPSGDLPYREWHPRLRRDSARRREDWDLINAGKKAVTLSRVTAFFHHADSFAMVRGGTFGCGRSLARIRWRRTAIWRTGATGPQGEPQSVAGRWTLSTAQSAVAVIIDHVTKDGQPATGEDAVRCH